MSSFIHPLQHFSRRIMSDALKEHDGNVSIGGRTITNLRLADGINAFTEKQNSKDQTNDKQQ